MKIRLVVIGPLVSAVYAPVDHRQAPDIHADAAASEAFRLPSPPAVKVCRTRCDARKEALPHEIELLVVRLRLQTRIIVPAFDRSRVKRVSEDVSRGSEGHGGQRPGK